MKDQIFESDGETIKDDALNHYTVTFTLRDESVAASYNVVIGAVVNVPAAPAMVDGYAFQGWTLDGTDIAIGKEETTWTVTGAAPFTAKYSDTPTTCTITWNLANGTSETTSVNYGAEPSHADDTKAASEWYTYTFAGWSPALAAATEDTAYTSTFNRTATQALTDLIEDAQEIVNNADDYDGDYQDEIAQIDELLDKYPDTITEEEIETLDGLVDGADAYVLYTVTFNYNGGSEIASDKLSGAVIEIPSVGNYTADGKTYVFNGWVNAADATDTLAKDAATYP